MLNIEPRAEHLRYIPDSALDDADRLRRVLAAHPDLAAYGWKVRDDALFVRSRLHLRDAVAEFTRALAFLRARPPLSPISSYAFKHAAERWHRERNPDAEAYISNGALIAAALAQGLSCERIPGTPNSRTRLTRGGRYVD